MLNGIMFLYENYVRFERLFSYINFYFAPSGANTPITHSYNEIIDDRDQSLFCII